MKKAESNAMILNGKGVGGSRLRPQRNLRMTEEVLVVTTWGGEEDILWASSG